MKLFFRSFQVFIIFFACFLLCPGNAESQSVVHKTEPVKIGLLVPDSNSVAALNGAQLAIKEANAAGGFNGRPFELVIKYLGGPWGTGSKQAVNLIFDEKVWVLMGSHDGRNAHLVEQVAAKSRVVFLSAWAGDPTLSQAFVPWFFNCIPNDDQQATIIADAVCSNGDSKRSAVISDDSYDSGSSLKSFMRKIREKGCNEPLQIIWENMGDDPEKVAELIQKSNTGTVILFCRPRTSARIAAAIRQKNINITVLAPLSVLDEDELSGSDMKCFDKLLAVPSTDWNEKELSSFREKYARTFNNPPGVIASFAFDGMNVLIQAIRNAGSNEREKIQKCLFDTNWQGITGPVRFDSRGNRAGKINLRSIKNGMPF
ncbi:MAG: ABC transporter substrate-binding protein [Bacteroidales bacterium]|jgi:branched-chain amino acid transport system substrate-binding protein